MMRTGWLPSLTLASLLALGFLVVWMLGSEWVLSVCLYVAGEERPIERLIFLLDGTALVEVEASEDGRQRKYRDLEGQPVPRRPTSDHRDRLRGTEIRTGRDSEEGRGCCLRSFADGRSPVGFWYYAGDGRADGSGYFVAYDSQSKTRIGYLGTAGFRAETPPPDELFPAGSGRQIHCTQPNNGTRHPPLDAGGRAPAGSLSSWDVYVAGHDGKIYHADLQERTVEVVCQGALRAAATVLGMYDPNGTPHHLAVRTEDSIVLLDEHGGGLNGFPIPASLRGRNFSFILVHSDEAVMYWKSPPDPVATEDRYCICWVGQDGCRRETTLSLPQDGEWVQLAGILFPTPALLAGYIVADRPPRLLREGQAATFAEAVAQSLADYRPALLLAQLVAAVLALACYGRQRRYGAGGAERWLWPLFVLLLGLPGWVGYRFGRTWPVLEACAELERPVLTGTEVFA
jgi:hypothetical protein